MSKYVAHRYRIETGSETMRARPLEQTPEKDLWTYLKYAFSFGGLSHVARIFFCWNADSIHGKNARVPCRWELAIQGRSDRDPSMQRWLAYPTMH
jgi:hypothetical protein